MDKKFWAGVFKPAALKQGDLILGVKIPFTKTGERCLYYRRARRKEFDLPIANAAFFGCADDAGVVQGTPNIVAGGDEGAFPGARVSPAIFLKETVSYLSNRSLATFDKKSLAEAVFKDVHVEERAPGEFSNYRRCLVAVFAERFLGDLIGKSDSGVGEKREPMSSHQLFEGVDPNQSQDDPVSRPVPQNWAA